jgi:hypothetical protein
MDDRGAGKQKASSHHQQSITTLAKSHPCSSMGTFQYSWFAPVANSSFKFQSRKGVGKPHNAPNFAEMGVQSK